VIKVKVALCGLDLLLLVEFPVKTVLADADDLALCIGHIVDAQFLHDSFAHRRLQEKTPFSNQNQQFPSRKEAYFSGRCAAGHSDEEWPLPVAEDAVSVGHMAL